MTAMSFGTKLLDRALHMTMLSPLLRERSYLPFAILALLFGQLKHKSKTWDQKPLKQQRFASVKLKMRTLSFVSRHTCLILRALWFIIIWGFGDKCSSKHLCWHSNLKICWNSRSLPNMICMDLWWPSFRGIWIGFAVAFRPMLMPLAIVPMSVSSSLNRTKRSLKILFASRFGCDFFSIYSKNIRNGKELLMLTCRQLQNCSEA